MSGASSRRGDPPPPDSKAAFLVPEGGKRKRKSQADAEEDVHFRILPSPHATYKEASVVEYHYINGNHPVRLADEPIQISLSIKKTVDNVKTYASATENLHIDPTVGAAASFIHGVEVYVNGVCLYTERRGIHGLYQSAMMKSCDTQYWRQHFIEAAATTPMHEAGKYPKALDFSKYSKWVTVSALHGVPFLGRPKNFYAHHRRGGKIWENRSPIIPPNASVTIKFTLVDSFPQRLFRTDPNISAYFTHTTDGKPPATKPAADDQDTYDAAVLAYKQSYIDPDEYEVEIEEMALLAERQKLKKFRLDEKDNYSFCFDAPQMHHSRIPPNSSIVHIDHSLPKNVDCAVTCFLYETQFNADTKVSDGLSGKGPLSHSLSLSLGQKKPASGVLHDSRRADSPSVSFQQPAPAHGNWIRHRCHPGRAGCLPQRPPLLDHSR